MVRHGDAQDEDARQWSEVHLPELTPERVKSLKRAGFQADKLRHLAATKYGRSLVVSVLICFTDAYPQAATTADIARAGEAGRMITTRSAAEFEKALAAHGLHSHGTPVPSPDKRPARVTGGYTTRTRWWLGWLLIGFLAIALTSGVAALDLGFGAVFGGIWLIFGFAVIVRRTVYGGAPVPKRVSRTYALAALGFLVASVGAADAVMVLAGAQGVGAIDTERRETGSHNTPYWVCTVREPDGNYADLWGGRACPDPYGTPVSMVYMPNDAAGVWRPILGTDASLAPMVALWGIGTLAGCGLLIRAATF
ncbi:hypothetical protein ABIA32_001289 [Streptacidiphilus sp. MAP12-20]|uniref:hypothetical protein n=1 Tax=Streptacidiphilus sp. MAP12-20 TaxID=3156299 RepID=UPI0035165B01